jgi:hypothetical protein
MIHFERIFIGTALLAAAIAISSVHADTAAAVAAKSQAAIASGDKPKRHGQPGTRRGATSVGKKKTS